MSTITGYHAHVYYDFEQQRAGSSALCGGREGLSSCGRAPARQSGRPASEGQLSTRLPSRPIWIRHPLASGTSQGFDDLCARQHGRRHQGPHGVRRLARAIRAPQFSGAVKKVSAASTAGQATPSRCCRRCLAHALPRRLNSRAATTLPYVVQRREAPDSATPAEGSPRPAPMRRRQARCGLRVALLPQSFFRASARCRSMSSGSSSSMCVRPLRARACACKSSSSFAWMA